MHQFQLKQYRSAPISYGRASLVLRSLAQDTAMPLTYRIDTAAQILFVHGEGVITQPERLQTILAWIKDPAYGPGLDTFCDFSATESTPKLSELREIVATIGDHASAIGPTKVAILTAKPVTFGVARVFEALAEVEGTPLQIKAFFDRDLAWAWLRPGGRGRSDQTSAAATDDTRPSPASPRGDDHTKAI
jgi:hypothetical protein